MVVPGSFLRKFLGLLGPIFLVGATLIHLITVAPLLRPIADDYGWGADFLAMANPVEVAGERYQSWTGDWVAAILKAVLVGMPLASLPTPFQSSIAFVATGLLLAAYVNLTTLGGAGLGSRQFKSIFWINLLVGLSWLGAYWAALGSDLQKVIGPQLAISRGLLHWQTVNVGYVAAGSLALMGIHWVLRGSGSTTYHKALRILIPIGVGLMGPILALASLAYLLLLLISQLPWWLENAARVRRLLFAIPGLGIGFGIYFFAPGQAIRAKNFSPPTEVKEQIRAFLESSYASLADWASLVISAPMLLMILIGIVIGASVRDVFRGRERALVSALLTNMALSLLLAIVAGVTAVFSYGAFWQLSFSYVLLLIAGYQVGVFFASYTGVRSLNDTASGTLLVMVMTLVIGLLGSVGTLNNFDDIRLRQNEWETGVAPVMVNQQVLISDREAEWVADEWSILARRGDLNRTNAPQ